MTSNLDKLKKLLAELFQLDQADLDFGIYRIMNQKRDEISHFLEKDLLPQVQEAFGIYKSADRVELEEELEKTIQGARAAGFDPEESPKVKEIRDGLAKYGVDTTALGNEVFSDLFDFFRRYYHEGDFLSLRRYKKGVYAIPYEGEEVKLHWANHDQYYIKTSEYLRDYTFKLPSGERVHFKLVEADTEKDNIKAQAGNERRFILSEENPMEEMDGELCMHLQYVPDLEKRKQKDLNAQAVDAVLNAKGFIEWRGELARLMPTDKNPERTLLEKHLTDYTARNTFDYFIHKDLGGFLKRELDFYIKNEIMHLDDIENETAPRVEQYLSKIRVIRKIAHKVIDFLAQIENFQKKLWLKKKFVVETNYCVTLDRVPEELYPEISANEEQREEWVRLFAIDEIDTEETDEPQPLPGMGDVTYSEPLTVEFLKANNFLVLDTKFFGEKFKNTLLAGFYDIDSKCDGVIIHSENFQALIFSQKKYRDNINSIYIDPPYNTGDGDFIYKDEYQHSSWLAMMVDRIKVARHLLSEQGTMTISIDDNEHHELRMCMETLFGAICFVGNAAWKKTSGSNESEFSHVFDNTLIFKKSPVTELGRIPRTEKQKKLYSNPDNDTRGPWASTDYTSKWSPSERPNLSYPIKRPDSEELVYPKEKAWRFSQEEHDRNVVEGKVWWGLKGELRVPRYKRFLSEVSDGVVPKSLWDDIDTNQHGKAQLVALGVSEEEFSNPKPIGLVQRCIQLSKKPQKVVLDFFAGSGTTAHAVINLNREDNGNRRYILVEMGDYFDTVLKPRIQKVIYSKDWKDGKPVSREGSSHMFKYIRLESYEDTLNNLELKRTEAQRSLLEQSDLFRESYMLSYMLDVESKGSASLLNVDSFEDPFNYKLKIATGSAGETKPITVDLVETFNYLLGLTVHHIDHIRGFRVVQGTNPKGEKVLVIWRNLKEKSNEDLDEFFRKQEYNPKDMEFDLIYVNGDNNLENLRRDDETWKVRLIEEDFKRLMFDVQDV